MLVDSHGGKCLRFAEVTGRGTEEALTSPAVSMSLMDTVTSDDF